MGMAFTLDEDGKKKEEKVVPTSNDPKFDILKQYDFIDRIARGKDGHTHKTYIVEFDEKDITLYDMWGEYGTSYKPNINPDKDPKPPEKKPTAPPSPTRIPKTEEPTEADGATPEEAKTPLKEEDPEEEKYEPPVDKIIFYDFTAHNGKDPILLSLMIKEGNDKAL